MRQFILWHERAILTNGWGCGAKPEQAELGLDKISLRPIKLKLIRCLVRVWIVYVVLLFAVVEKLGASCVGFVSSYMDYCQIMLENLYLTKIRFASAADRFGAIELNQIKVCH